MLNVYSGASVEGGRASDDETHAAGPRGPSASPGAPRHPSSPGQDWARETLLRWAGRGLEKAARGTFRPLVQWGGRVLAPGRRWLRRGADRLAAGALTAGSRLLRWGGPGPALSRAVPGALAGAPRVVEEAAEAARLSRAAGALRTGGRWLGPVGLAVAGVVDGYQGAREMTRHGPGTLGRAYLAGEAAAERSWAEAAGAHFRTGLARAGVDPGTAGQAARVAGWTARAAWRPLTDNLTLATEGGLNAVDRVGTIGREGIARFAAAATWQGKAWSALGTAADLTGAPFQGMGMALARRYVLPVQTLLAIGRGTAPGRPRAAPTAPVPVAAPGPMPRPAPPRLARLPLPVTGIPERGPGIPAPDLRPDR